MPAVYTWTVEITATISTGFHETASQAIAEAAARSGVNPDKITAVTARRAG